jgi:hypothetical protein
MTAAIGGIDPIVAITNALRAIKMQLEVNGFPRPSVSIGFGASRPARRSETLISIKPLGENGARVDGKEFDTLPEAQAYAALVTNKAALVEEIKGRLPGLDAYALYRTLVTIEAEQHTIEHGHAR